MVSFLFQISYALKDSNISVALLKDRVCRIAMGAGTNYGCMLSRFLSHRRMNGGNPTTYLVTSNSMRDRRLVFLIFRLMLSTEMDMSVLHFVPTLVISENNPLFAFRMIIKHAHSLEYQFSRVSQALWQGAPKLTEDQIWDWAGFKQRAEKDLRVVGVIDLLIDRTIIAAICPPL